MPYRLSVNTEEGYVRCDLSDTLSQAEIDSAIAELGAIRQEHGISHILCDERDLRVPPNDVVGFFTARRLTSGPFAGIKLAIIRTDTTKERLFEVAASNRGATVQVFDDEKKAIQWLQQSDT